jgi:hypothetical protein
MLPASDLTEIIANLSALNLQPNTAAQILAAVLVPLLRSSGPPPEPIPIREKRPRSKPQKRKTSRADDSPRERAIAALKANPGVPLSDIAKLAGCARSTAVNARNDLAKKARKQARKSASAPAATSVLAKQTARRERAQRFLRDELARGPRSVSDIEERAAKAHVDQHTLEQARGDLGVITSRGNTGNTLSVQWSLPTG